MQSPDESMWTSERNLFYQYCINRIKSNSFPSSFLYKHDFKPDILYIPRANVRKDYKEEQVSQGGTEYTGETEMERGEQSKGKEEKGGRKKVEKRRGEKRGLHLTLRAEPSQIIDS